MRITFFKTGKPRSFNYVPRYYDEQKEEFENREKRIKQELGVDEAAGYRSRLTQGVMTNKLNAKRKAGKGSTLRLLIIIAILTLLALYLLRDAESLSSFIK